MMKNLKSRVVLLSVIIAALCFTYAVTFASDEWVCSSCGNTATGNFCSSCGNPRPEEPVDIDDDDEAITLDDEEDEAKRDLTVIIPNDEIWGMSPDEIKNSIDFSLVDSSMSDMPALKASNVSVDGHKMDIYYLFKEENSLSAIAYLLVDTKDQSKEDRQDFTVNMIAELKTILGEPSPQDKKTAATWKEEQYTVKIGIATNEGDKYTSIIVKPTGGKNKPANTIGKKTNSDYELVKDYKWSILNTWFYEGLVIRNTSGLTKDFDAKVMFYDANNQLIGVGNFTADVVADGHEALIQCSNESSFDHIEYTITAKDTRYKEVQSFVDIQVQTPESKAIIIATNNGNVAAEFVEYKCLFINDQGQVVGTGWGYLVDDDSELKPGASEFREESCYEPFSTIEIYFTGRYR